MLSLEPLFAISDFILTFIVTYTLQSDKKQMNISISFQGNSHPQIPQSQIWHSSTSHYHYEQSWSALCKALNCSPIHRLRHLLSLNDTQHCRGDEASGGGPDSCETLHFPIMIGEDRMEAAWGLWRLHFSINCAILLPWVGIPCRE